jgi:hypothetical protein
MGPLRNANATMLLASAANCGSNVIFRLGIGVFHTRNLSTPKVWMPIFIVVERTGQL